jgi:hypothetical protein
MFCAMLIAMEAGRRMGIRKLAQDPAGVNAGTIEGALFALLGLLLAFTFSSAGSRFDARRQLVVEEANAIGTAYLRLDLLPDEARAPLRELFRAYLESRLETYRTLPDIEEATQVLAKTSDLQGEIWAKAVLACRASETTAAPMLLLPALNQMIDITTTRTMAAKMHSPPVVFVLLLALELMCSFVSGYGMAGAKTRSWVHTIAFLFAAALTLFVILDIEFPRMGFIHVREFDQVLQDLLNSMRK